MIDYYDEPFASWVVAIHPQRWLSEQAWNDLVGNVDEEALSDVIHGAVTEYLLNGKPRITEDIARVSVRIRQHQT